MQQAQADIQHASECGRCRKPGRRLRRFAAWRSRDTSRQTRSRRNRRSDARLRRIGNSGTGVPHRGSRAAGAPRSRSRPASNLARRLVASLEACCRWSRSQSVRRSRSCWRNCGWLPLSSDWRFISLPGVEPTSRVKRRASVPNSSITIQRVDHVAVGFAHFMAVFIADQTVQIDGIEGDFAGEFQART